MPDTNDDTVAITSMNLPKRTLGTGTAALEVSAIGLGCMGFTVSWPPFLPHDESIRVIRAAYEMGERFFDTAEVYGPFTNEELVGEALEPFRNDVVAQAGRGADAGA